MGDHHSRTRPFTTSFATTELTSISSYPPAVAYNRNHSYTTRDQASQFNLFPQPIYPPGDRQINKAANMSTTEKPKDKLEAQIKSADMTDDMQQEAIDVAQEAMNKFTVEKDIAMHIKKTFDERKGPTWHLSSVATSDHLSLTRQST